jgi:hypothetical protein
MPCSHVSYLHVVVVTSICVGYQSIGEDRIPTMYIRCHYERLYALYRHAMLLSHRPLVYKAHWIDIATTIAENCGYRSSV